MKSRGFICQFNCSWAWAFQSVFIHLPNSFVTQRHRTQFSWCAISQPQAPTNFIVDKLFCSIPTAEIWSRLGLFLQKLCFFFISKQIIATVYRFVANTNFWYFTYWFVSALNPNIRRINKIPIDILRLNRLAFVEEYGLVFNISINSKANNNTMHMGFHLRFAVPSESAIGKTNL